MRQLLHTGTQHRHFANGQAYDRRAARVFAGIYRRVADDMAAAAPPGSGVLDAGCGSGRLAIEIARRRPDLHVRGVDLERGMIDVAVQRAMRENLAERVEFTVADLAELELPESSVDLIVSTASMHHWADIGAVIASLDRVLRADGRLWIYEMRWVPTDAARVAAAELGRDVDRTLVRTGWFPAALFQRLAIEGSGPLAHTAPRSAAASG